MSAEEILAQLRDIHFPDAAGGSTELVFAWWPFAVFAGFSVLFLVLRYIGRTHWRRQAKRDLARIAALDDAETRWDMLLRFSTTLSERSGRTVALPEAAFRHPEKIGSDERARFLSFLRAELAR